MFVNHQYSALLQIFFVGWFLKKFCAYGGRGIRRNPEDAKIGRGERSKSGVGLGGGGQENGYKPCLDHIIIFLNHAVYVFLRFL